LLNSDASVGRLKTLIPRLVETPLTL
jgi:hypothetical protein